MMDYDYIIVGAGPAGLQMAYFLHQSNRRYVVLEAKEKAASFFTRQPRSNRLISINKRYNFYDEDTFNLRHDWNSLLSDDSEMRFPNYSDDLYPKATDLHNYMNDFARKFELNIAYNSTVSCISKPRDMFTVKTKDGKIFSSRCLLMATGPMEENLPETVEGIDLCDTYDQFDMDKARYKNKIVLVLGGGNSAFETAHYLSDVAGIVHVAMKKQIDFAWNTHYVGDLRAVNNNILDMYQLKSLHAALAHRVVKVQRNEKNGKLVATYIDLNTHWETPGWLYFEIEYDNIISCLGWKYIKPEMFDATIKIETVKDGRYPKLSTCWETDTENMFYIGSAMGAIDRESASGFVHGFRYNIRTLHSLLENRFFSTPFPSIQLPFKDLTAIADWVLQRFTTVDSLYQMNTFLCDCLIFEDGDTPRIYTDLPRKHATDMPQFKSAKHLFIMYLAYGFDKYGRTAPPITIVHSPEFSTSRCAGLLHPILEYRTMGKYVDQTELQESLLIRYDKQSRDNFPQWSYSTNLNYVKFFINDKMKWTEQKFDLTVEDLSQIDFVPLTEEEKARIPPLWEPSECKPGQELLPVNSDMEQKVRVFRPTAEDLRASAQKVS